MVPNDLGVQIVCGQRIMKINNHVVCKAVDEYIWLWLYVFMYGYVVPNKSVIVEKF